MPSRRASSSSSRGSTTSAAAGTFDTATTTTSTSADVVIVDQQAKASLHAVLHRLHLPLPRYETIARTTYTMHIHLSATVREKLTQHTRALPAALATALKLDPPSSEPITKHRGREETGHPDEELTFCGRPARHKRDAVARSAGTLAALLEQWAVQEESDTLRARQGDMANKLREVERKQKMRLKRREKRKRAAAAAAMSTYGGSGAVPGANGSGRLCEGRSVMGTQHDRHAA
ncbi:hypothetical protein Slin15195_G129050 [Septoria linicola]|uniref:Uncharacterized protein n=1 Tax=Septoria linicola TaxID=215465 RepID=A0A9Q9B9M3_9PEZI|nr:hypothetical protein Slin14017_G121580 [Septoria linicola]USW59586.1 hypothetical protein Slin15195_G129050 [Septoria linicola]